MVRRVRYLGVSSESTGSATCAGWTGVLRGSTGESSLLLVVKIEGDGRSRLELARYSFEEQLLQDEVCVLPAEEAPLALAVHPGGDEALCSFRESCRLVHIQESSLSWSDQEVQGLPGAGKICFTGDGSRVAFGGKDGHLRVLEWPSLTTLIDEPKAHKSIKDIDFSLDGALLASTSEDGPCRVWDLSKGTALTSLHRDKAERFGLCRFSRSGPHPFLFVTTYKDGKGSVAVWDIVNWNRLGFKSFMDCEITALATSCDGKRLAIGGRDGAIAVVWVKSMEKRLHARNAHASCVTLVEMSANSRALLSVSVDGNARVSATDAPAPWKDWQVYSILVALIALSAVLFYIFFEFSDSFWDFPLGRNQPAKPSMRAAFTNLDSSTS